MKYGPMKYVLHLAIALLSYSASAQLVDNSREMSLKDRLLFGGNFSAAFGNFTQVMVEPSVGFIATDRYFTSLGIQYNYIQIRDWDYRSSWYGFRSGHQYWVTPSLFLAGDAELLNWQPYATGIDGSSRVWAESLFLGGGVRIQSGGRSLFSVSLLYNVAYDSNSPYNSAWMPRINLFF